MHTHFFVYGTLKRGQCRESCWPIAPIAVQPAITRGQLYDTGPYPAMIEGDDWVLGELWSFHDSDHLVVARTLDVVEEYDENAVDSLYIRKLITCISSNGDEFVASTYLYARLQQLATFRKVTPTQLFDGKVCSQWPAEKLR